MKFFLLEVILCVSHITLNEKIIFYYLNPFHPTLISAPSIASMLTASSWWQPLRSFLKEGASSMLDAHNQLIMRYTLMAARADQPPIWVFPWRWPFGGLLVSRRLAYVGCLKPIYNGIYLDDYSSRSTAYMGPHPDDDPSGGIPKY